MNKPLISQIVKAYKKNGYKIFDGFDERGKFKTHDLNIFGIRSKDRTTNIFNDLIGVFYKMTTDSTTLHTWVATVDPGLYYLQNPMNPSGTFALKPGQYLGAYKIGLHHTQDALVQVGKLIGFRDNNRDNIIDLDPSKGYYDGNNFGVNIHHKEIDSEFVDMGSAGCQVFKSTEDHGEFMGLCCQAAAIWYNLFSYTLLDDEDVFC